ncbi:sigma-70 family RNA polymerase sigma factor [bacterium]|nr:MAG: sigma-70 family RNA polymerase sigma factor [bacterium]
MNPLDDSALLQRYVAEGSEDAFRTLAERYAPLVFGTCRRRTGRDDLAEDAAQVVFIALARNASRLIDHPSLSGWLYTSANTVSKRVMSEEARRMKHERANSTEEAVDPSITASLRLHLDEAMERLRRGDREAVMLRYLQGYTLAEVAGAMKIGEDAARMRVNRAIEKLRKEFHKIGLTVTLPELLTSMPNVNEPLRPEMVRSISAAPSPTVVAQSLARVQSLTKGTTPTMFTLSPLPLAVSAAALTFGIACVSVPHNLSASPAALPQTSKDDRPSAPLVVNPVSKEEAPRLLKSWISRLEGSWKVIRTREVLGRPNQQESFPSSTVEYDKSEERIVVRLKGPRGEVPMKPWSLYPGKGAIRTLDLGLPPGETPFFEPTHSIVQKDSTIIEYACVGKGLKYRMIVTMAPDHVSILVASGRPVADEKGPISIVTLSFRK